MSRRNAEPARVIKFGGLYRDTALGLVVVAEDHEVRDGQRTGRVLVHTASGEAWRGCRYLAPVAGLVEASGLEGPRAGDGEVQP